HRPLWVGTDNLHVRILRLEVAGDAGDRATRADAGDEVGDAARRLAPDLGIGAAFVGDRVLGVVVLAGLKGAGDLARQPVGHRVVRVGVLGRDSRRTDDDLRSVRAQQTDLLLAHLVGHDEDAPVAAAGGDDGETHARVA